MKIEGAVIGSEPFEKIAREPVRESSNVSVVDRNETTQRLTIIWQQLLGIEPIAPDQNYFDLGGDSILAVQLFAQIEREFKVKLPVATLFEALTVAELAQLICKDSPASGWSSLVAIQPDGSRPPFFVIHGGGGTLLIYRELSKHLGPDQPLFGLQSQGLDGELPILRTVEEMAALYIREIRRVTPNGPYFVGGYCGGGTIALEIAQQLCAMGYEVALLALFDTSNWSKILPLTGCSKIYQYSERIAFHALNFFGLDSEGKSQFLREKLNAVRNRIPVWSGMLQARITGRVADNPNSRLLAEMWESNDRATIRYIPKPYPGVITDFRPKCQYRMFDKPGAKWENLALGGQEVITLPVYPAGMLVEPFVRRLASALRASIDKSIRKQAVA